jgi:hypothetical protein
MPAQRPRPKIPLVSKTGTEMTRSLFRATALAAGMFMANGGASLKIEVPIGTY